MAKQDLVAVNPHFSPAFAAKRRRRLWMQGASGGFSASATEGPAGMLDSMSRIPIERNAVARIRRRSRKLVRNAG